MLDRKTPPPFVHSTTFELIKPVQQDLSNGVRTFLIPGGSQDVLKIEFIFSAGRWHENKTGASHFAANLLSKGTSGKNSYQIAQIFDRFGAHVEIHPGFDHISVSVYTVAKYLGPVMDLFMEIIRDPAFPSKELDQHKDIFIQNLKVNEEKTSFLASKAFRKRLFGAEHPYGKELEEADVINLQPADLRRHYETFVTTPLVFVAGKISSEAEAIIMNAARSMPASAKADIITHPPSGTSGFHDVIGKEGSVQSSIRTGKKSILRKHPDYPAIIFVLHILGGYFGSRLMKNIREEKGLTYGIYASLQPLQRESFIVIGADVNKENVGLTLDEIRKEIRDLRTKQVGEEELETAKNHFIGSLQSEITTPFAHADKIKTLVLSELPEGYYDELIRKIDTITPEQIIRTSEEYIHEESFSSVSVG